MQLQSQCVRIQLQEYRGNEFVKGTSKQFRVYNCTVDELMALVHRAVEHESHPAPVAAPPISAIDPSAPKVKKPRTLSAEARAKISATQKKRWETRSRTLTDESKQKIADSQRARWKRKHQKELEAEEPSVPAAKKPMRNLAEIKTRPLGNDMYMGV